MSIISVADAAVAELHVPTVKITAGALINFFLVWLILVIIPVIVVFFLLVEQCRVFTEYE